MYEVEHYCAVCGRKLKATRRIYDVEFATVEVDEFDVEPCPNCCPDSNKEKIPTLTYGYIYTNTCPECGGSGKIYKYNENTSSLSDQYVYVICPRCHGSGVV